MLEQMGLQSDFLIQDEILPGAWQIVQVSSSYPEDDLALENEKLAE